MKEDRKRNKRKRIIKFWIRFLILLLLAGGVFFCLKSPLFNVSEFTVTGNSYYNSNEILVMGNCKTGGNIFTGIDTKDIKARLMNDAYMADVVVKRKLPSTIEIVLNERKQIAALVYGEKFIVIDNQNMVLRKTSVDPQVSIIKGITLTKLNVGEACEIEEKVQLRQAIELIETAQANDMYFKAIEFINSEMKCYVLDNLACQGSLQDLKSGLESGAVQGVISDLLNKGIERGTVNVIEGNYVSYSPAVD